MSPTRDRRLDPVRWPRPPRLVTVARTALVAALLLTAAGVLYAAPDDPPPTATGSRRAPHAAPAPPSAGATPALAGALPGQPPDGQLPVPTGAVGVPIRLADSAALAVVRPGDRVDLLAVADGPRTASPVAIATGALVLAVPVDADQLGRAAVYLALSPGQARQAVGLPPGVRFAVVVRP